MSKKDRYYDSLWGFSIEYKDEAFYLTKFYKDETSSTRRIVSISEAVRATVHMEEDLRKVATKPEVVPTIVPSHRRIIDLAESGW